MILFIIIIFRKIKYKETKKISRFQEIWTKSNQPSHVWQIITIFTFYLIKHYTILYLTRMVRISSVSRGYKKIKITTCNIIINHAKKEKNRKTLQTIILTWKKHNRKLFRHAYLKIKNLNYVEVGIIKTWEGLGKIGFGPG